MTSVAKQNWFQTLQSALESEDLVNLWEVGLNINYGQTASMIADDGTKHGHYITVYRSDTGLYERAVHYPLG